MIDNINAGINNPKISEIEKNNDFKIVVSEKSGEIIGGKKESKDHFMSTVIYDSGTVYVNGSLHKYYNSIKGIEAPNYIRKLQNAKTEKEREKIIKNNKGFNGNDFMLSEILESIDRLCDKLSTKPEQVQPINLETGVNLVVGFDPNLFIRGQLYHRGKPFKTGHERNYVEVEHQRYTIKIYNKGKLYGMDKYVLRIEVKLKTTEEINKLGIKTLADINTKTLNNCKDLILKRLNEIVYYDMTISKKGLNKTEINNLYKYQGKIFWLDELKPNQRYRHLKKLNNLIENNSQNLRDKISKKIIEKCSIITKEFAPEKEQKTQRNKKRKCSIITSLTMDVNVLHDEVKERVLFDDLNNDKKEVKKDEVKRCIITGINLDLENDNSVYIKTSTIRHLKENDYFKFQNLVKALIPNTGIRPKYERNVITHLAKQVRNRYYSPNPIKRIGYNRKMFNNPNQLTLFI